MLDTEKKVTKAKFYNIKGDSNSGKNSEYIQRTYHISSSTVRDIVSSPSFEYYVRLKKNKARQHYNQRNSLRIAEKGHQMQNNQLGNPFSDNLGAPSEKVYTEYKPPKTGKGIPLAPLTQEEYQRLLDMTKRGMNKEEMARHMGARNAVQLFGRVKKTREHELGFLSALEDSKRIRAERTMQIRNKNLEKSPMRNGEFKSVYVKREVTNKPKFINGMPAAEFYKKNLEKARLAKDIKNGKVKPENAENKAKVCETKDKCACENKCECANRTKDAGLEVELVVELVSRNEASILVSGLFMTAVLAFMAMINVLTIEPGVAILPSAIAGGIFLIRTLFQLYAIRFLAKFLREETDNDFKIKIK